MGFGTNDFHFEIEGGEKRTAGVHKAHKTDSKNMYEQDEAHCLDDKTKILHHRILCLSPGHYWLHHAQHYSVVHKVKKGQT